jgi:hypothetical protein
MDASPKFPILPLLIGVVLGLAVGLLIGWVIWPVQYVGQAYTYDLNAAEKAQYVAAVADSYSLTGQINVVRQRLNTWTPEEKIGALAQLFADDQAQGKMAEAAKVAEMAGQLRQLEGWTPAVVSQVTDQIAAQYTKTGALDKAQYVKVFEAGLGAAPAAAPAPVVTAAPAAAPQAQIPLVGDLDIILRVCGVLLVILLVAAIVALIIMRRRAAPQPTAAEKAAAEWTGAGPVPLMQWKSSYSLGMDNFDQSSGIEGDNEQYLGDVGIGIAQMGVLDAKETPRRVMAFEAWLFDKGRGTLKTTTVTKVLMSDFAYQNEIVRKKLVSRGEGEAFEPVLAAPGAIFTLETDFLVAQARVAEMEYGEGTPPLSFFKNLTINFDIHQKGEPLGDSGLPAPPAAREVGMQ